MSGVLEITRKFTLLGKLRHYLFDCPTFWRLKPAFRCPVCGDTYRCYWDGNDVGGKINVCKTCIQGGWKVLADLARTLERDLASANDFIGSWKAEEDGWLKREKVLMDALTAARLDHDAECGCQEHPWNDCNCGASKHNYKIDDAIMGRT